MSTIQTCTVKQQLKRKNDEYDLIKWLRIVFLNEGCSYVLILVTAGLPGQPSPSLDVPCFYTQHQPPPVQAAGSKADHRLKKPKENVQVFIDYTYLHTNCPTAQRLSQHSTTANIMF